MPDPKRRVQVVDARNQFGKQFAKPSLLASATQVDVAVKVGVKVHHLAPAEALTLPARVQIGAHR